MDLGFKFISFYLHANLFYDLARTILFFFCRNKKVTLNRIYSENWENSVSTQYYMKFIDRVNYYARSST